jgi:hypothetical protein
MLLGLGVEGGLAVVGEGLGALEAVHLGAPGGIRLDGLIVRLTGRSAIRADHGSTTEHHGFATERWACSDGPVTKTDENGPS